MPFNPRTHGGGDILARAHAVSHIWEAKMVFAPDREWANMVISEMASLPKAAHDDVSSSAIQGIKYLRDKGLLSMRDEREEELDKLYSHKAARPLQLPYEC